MKSIRKEFLCELKQIGNPEDRTIRFVASDESIDRDSDIIEVAGWKLDNFKKTGVILYGHDYSTKTGCIGKDAIKDLASKKLYVDIYFPTVEELSTNPEYAYEMAKFPDFLYCACKLGAEMGKAACVSVGFKGIKFKTRDDPEVLEKPEWQRGKRYLEQELLELSIVEVPANANALQQLKDTGKITDKEIENYVQKGLIHTETKKADLEGNPSTWDIMHTIRTAINPTGVYMECGPWIEDLYPTRYPSGSVILEKNSKYYLYQYEYTNGIATLSTEYTELEETYKPKGYSKILETIPAELKEVDLLVDPKAKEIFVTMNSEKIAKVKTDKELFEKYFDIEEKSGATLSQKTKEMLNKVCEDMKGCGDRLRKFVDTSGMIEDEPPEDMPMMSTTRTTEITEIKIALEEIKSQVFLLSQKSNIKVIAKEIYELQKDANEDISLDAIEFSEIKKDAAQNELDIKPEELKQLIKEIINNQIRGGM